VPASVRPSLPHVELVADETERSGLRRLLDKLSEMRETLGKDQVFDVLVTCCQAESFGLAASGNPVWHQRGEGPAQQGHRREGGEGLPKWFASTLLALSVVDG